MGFLSRPSAHYLHHHQLAPQSFQGASWRPGSRCEKRIRPKRPAAGQAREVTGCGQTSHNVLPSQIKEPGASCMKKSLPTPSKLAPSPTTTSKYS